MDKDTLEKRAQELAQKELSEESESTKENAENSQKAENNLPVENVSLESLQQQYLQNQVKQGSSLNDISVDYAKANTTISILKDESEEAKRYRKELAEEQKQTIKEGFKQDKVKEQKKTLDEKQKKAEAFYNGVRPILEFDFSNLIHKDKPKDINEKTYADRSYGIILMIGMLFFLTIPYFIISIILALFNGVNAVLEEINTFGKIAKYVVLSIVIIMFSILIIYATICGIEAIFKVNILPLGK